MTSFHCFVWNVVANLVVMPYKTQDLNLVAMPWPTLLTFSLFRSFLLISFNCPIKWQFNLTVMLLKISFKCLIVCFVRLLITAVDIAYFPPVLFCALFNLLIIFDFWFFSDVDDEAHLLEDPLQLELHRRSPKWRRGLSSLRLSILQLHRVRPVKNFTAS